MMEFDVVDTLAGPCMIAMDGGRVVRLHLGRHARFEGRRARLPRARRWLAQWFSGRSPRVPLKIEGGLFVRRVVRAVRRIPVGETRTYAGVARAAGHPGAARAVGNALARNPICLFIPCHRVVAASGLGGFSGEGGPVLKQRLLALEGCTLEL